MKALLVFTVLFAASTVSAQGLIFAEDIKFEWESMPAVVTVTGCSKFRICVGNAVETVNKKNGLQVTTSKVVSCRTTSDECPSAQSCKEKSSVESDNGFTVDYAKNAVQVKGVSNKREFEKAGGKSRSDITPYKGNK